MHADELPTPALVIDAEVFDRNLATMTAHLPGDRLRPHVKAQSARPSPPHNRPRAI